MKGLGARLSEFFWGWNHLEKPNAQNAHLPNNSNIGPLDLDAKSRGRTTSQTSLGSRYSRWSKQSCRSNAMSERSQASTATSAAKNQEGKKSEKKSRLQKMKDTALGYVRRVFGSSNTEKAFRVHLPDDSEKKIKWDPKLKRWVDTNAPKEEEQAPPEPPPMDILAANPTTSQTPLSAETQTRNKFSLKSSSKLSKYKNAFSSSTTAAKNVMPPPFLPAGGPPASSVGGTELFTPAPVLPDGPLSLEPVFEKPIPLQYDFGGPPPVKPAQSFHQPTPDVQQELMKLAINAPEEKKQTSPVPSPMTATNNVMPPAVLPAGGPPAKTMGGPMILTPAQAVPDGSLSLEPVFEKPMPLQHDFGGPPPVNPAQSFHQPTPDVQQELMKCDPNLKQWMDSNTPEEKQQAPTVPPPMTVSAAEPTTSQAPPGNQPMYKNGFSSSTTATNNVMTAVPVFPTAGPPAQTMGGPMILTPAPDKPPIYQSEFSSSSTATNNAMTVPVFPAGGPPVQTMGGPTILTPAPGKPPIYQNEFSSSNIAKNNVVPPPIIPSGGPPALIMGEPMILTPAQVLPSGPLSLEPVFEKPIPLQYDFGGPPPVNPAQTFCQPTFDVQQEMPVDLVHETQEHKSLLSFEWNRSWSSRSSIISERSRQSKKSAKSKKKSKKNDEEKMKLDPNLKQWVGTNAPEDPGLQTCSEVPCKKAGKRSMFKNPFRSSNTAKKNVMPPPVLPAGGPPAQKVGRPMILTPAQGKPPMYHDELSSSTTATRNVMPPPVFPGGTPAQTMGGPRIMTPATGKPPMHQNEFSSPNTAINNVFPPPVFPAGGPSAQTMGGPTILTPATGKPPMHQNEFSSSTTATSNVFPPPVFPAGGPPAQTMGGPMILTPANGKPPMYQNEFSSSTTVSRNMMPPPLFPASGPPVQTMGGPRILTPATVPAGVQRFEPVFEKPIPLQHDLRGPPSMNPAQSFCQPTQIQQGMPVDLVAKTQSRTSFFSSKWKPSWSSRSSTISERSRQSKKSGQSKKKSINDEKEDTGCGDWLGEVFGSKDQQKAKVNDARVPDDAYMRGTTSAVEAFDLEAPRTLYNPAQSDSAPKLFPRPGRISRVRREYPAMMRK